MAASPKAKLLPATSCVDRYNSLLMDAKAALVNRDRALALDRLDKDYRMLSTCTPLEDGPSRPSMLISAMEIATGVQRLRFGFKMSAEQA
jgi:hypothetical protein